MRRLKIATIVMGVLILLGTTVLIVTIVKRSTTPGPVVSVSSAPVSAVLDEPAGTRIIGIVSVRDRLAIQLQGGGMDRVVLVDPVTGTVMGQVSLAR